MALSRLLAAALSIALLPAIAAAPSAWASCPGQNSPASVQPEAQIEQAVLCLINERRGGAGLGAVGPNSKLRAAGLRHSTEMVSQGFFGHTSPAGVGFIDRILDTGYTAGRGRWVVGENLVWGSDDLSTPAALVQAWMDSPPHRENLLRPRFREVGVAAVKGTPMDRSDQAGVTVSSEYGFRGKPKKKGKRKRKKRKKLRKRR